MICERCNQQSLVSTTSYFDTKTICMDCKKKEQNHPDYKKAVEAEIAEVKKGNFNFVGIGKPADL